MKTVDEWMDFWKAKVLGDKPFMREFIHDVQSEAYHEGQLAGLQTGKETAMKTIEEVFSKPAERSESV